MNICNWGHSKHPLNHQYKTCISQGTSHPTNIFLFLRLYEICTNCTVLQARMILYSLRTDGRHFSEGSRPEFAKLLYQQNLQTCSSGAVTLFRYSARGLRKQCIIVTCCHVWLTSWKKPIGCGLGKDVTQSVFYRQNAIGDYRGRNDHRMYLSSKRVDLFSRKAKHLDRTAMWTSRMARCVGTIFDAPYKLSFQAIASMCSFFIRYDQNCGKWESEILHIFVCYPLPSFLPTALVYSIEGLICKVPHLCNLEITCV